MKKENLYLSFPAALQEKTLLIGDRYSLQLLTEGQITEGIIIAQQQRFQLFTPRVAKGFSNPVQKALLALQVWAAVEELSSFKAVEELLIRLELQGELLLSAGTPVALWQRLSARLTKPLPLGYLRFSISKGLRARVAELQHRLEMAAIYLYSSLEPQLNATQLAIEIKHYLLLQTDGLAEGTVNLEFFRLEGEHPTAPVYCQTLSPQRWVNLQFTISLKGLELYYGRTIFYGLTTSAADCAAYAAGEAYFKSCLPRAGEGDSSEQATLALKSWNPLTNLASGETGPSDLVRQLAMKDRRNGFLFSALLEKSNKETEWKLWENSQTSLVKVF